jgi:TPR repeat protein
LEAYFNLGSLYELGLGVEKDPKMAIKHYKIAAEGVNITK